MNKIKSMLLSILYIIKLIIIPLIIANGFFYLLGSFIAADWNPQNWWLFTSVWGRALFVFIEISILSQTPNFWED